MDELRKKLISLDELATPGLWVQYSASYGPWEEQAGRDFDNGNISCLDTSHHVSTVNQHGRPYRLAEFTHADDAALSEALVNAYRSGDLVTREELKAAVEAEREACAEIAEEYSEPHPTQLPVAYYIRARGEANDQ